MYNIWGHELKPIGRYTSEKKKEVKKEKIRVKKEEKQAYRSSKPTWPCGKWYLDKMSVISNILYISIWKNTSRRESLIDGFMKTTKGIH